MSIDEASAGNEPFRLRIRQERERKAWTQADLAERIGASRINVTRWEKGTTTPGPYYRQRLAEAFNKSIEELGFLSARDEEEVDEFQLGKYPESRREKNWYVPYRPNQYFTGRKEILGKLRAELMSQKAMGSMLALSGLGGVGKTQIAIEYAYTYRPEYDSVLWINAYAPETISGDLVIIASLLNLAQPQEPEEVIGQVVKNWLRRHENWLLILDNADDLDTAIDFLPKDGMGDVLLTTRKLVVGSMAQRVVVEDMSKKEGVSFLLRRAKLLERGERTETVSEENRRYAEQIVEEMGGLPLALDQAGAYIEETQCGLAQYLERYKTHRQELLKRRGILPHNHRESVATTWQISFKEIEKEWPASAELLSLCAFLSSDFIPEELLVLGAPKLGPLLSQKLTDEFQLDDVLRPLHLYSLIQRVPETGSLSMHRLVQAVLRQNVSFRQQKQWAKHIIEALDLAFPEPENKNWGLCQRLLSQVQSCIQLSEEYELPLPELARLCEHAGMYTFDRALFEQASSLFRRAITIYEQLARHEETYEINIAANQHRLGELYRVLGRYTEAEELIRSALAGYEQWQPTDQLDNVIMLTSLGELYHNVRRYQEAEDLFKQAHSITQERFGPDHYANAIPLHHLARLYGIQERFEDAEPLFLQALKLQRQASKNEIELAVTLNNLATLYRGQDQYERAEELLKQTLDIEERLLGPNDPHTATAMQNLGIVYMRQENYTDAEKYLRQALDVKEKTLGVEHQGTIRTMTNLAYVYRKQKRFKEAKSLLKKALAYNEKLEQASSAAVLRNLGNVYFDEGKLEKAEDYYLQALEMSEKDKPGAQQSKKRVLRHLIELYEVLGEEDRVEYYKQQSIEQ